MKCRGQGAYYVHTMTHSLNHMTVEELLVAAANAARLCDDLHLDPATVPASIADMDEDRAFDEVRFARALAPPTG